MEKKHGTNERTQRTALTVGSENFWRGRLFWNVLDLECWRSAGMASNRSKKGYRCRSKNINRFGSTKLLQRGYPTMTQRNSNFWRSKSLLFFQCSIISKYPLLKEMHSLITMQKSSKPSTRFSELYVHCLKLLFFSQTQCNLSVKTLL